jgi:hypothetical protein
MRPTLWPWNGQLIYPDRNVKIPMQTLAASSRQIHYRLETQALAEALKEIVTYDSTI